MLKVMQCKVSCCCLHFEAADSLSVFALVTDCKELGGMLYTSWAVNSLLHQVIELQELSSC